MSSTNQDSGVQSDPADARPRDSFAALSRPHVTGAISLEGDVLSCACPECQAPMSIRLWLMVADCWRCGTSIELSLEQQQEAMRLWEQRQSIAAPPAAAAAPPQPVVPSTNQALAPATQPAAPAQLPVAQLAAPRPAAWSQPIERQAPAAPPGRMLAAARPSHIRLQLHRLKSEGAFKVWFEGLFKNMSSWLVSLMVHMLLIILLGIWIIHQEERPELMLLSTSVSGLHEEGEARLLETMSPSVTLESPELKPLSSASDFASTAFREPLAEPVATSIALPSGEMLTAVTPDIKLPSVEGGHGKMLAGRDPHVRAKILVAEGGTTETEAAVARGLKWLAAHQNADGRWSLDEFDHAGDCNGRCELESRRAIAHSDTSGTALGLLPFLGAGQTHLRGNYYMTVAKGLRALMDQQRPDGDLRGAGSGQMYAHGQAAIALCEAYALTHDSLLRGPAQRAIDFIVNAQGPDGGWRYRPKESIGDTSVVGWQLMALRSAQMADLQVPDNTFAKAMLFLNAAQTEKKRGLFSYMPGGDPTPTMTAEGLLSRQYAGWKQSDPALVAGVDWIRQQKLLSRKDRSGTPVFEMYFLYYATQVMHHMGGKIWEEWNADMRRVLLDTQEREGHAVGSWAPMRSHDLRGGRVYMTSLACCTLEVYYRHLPLYRGKAVPNKKP